MPSFAESSEGDSDGSISSLSLKRSVEAEALVSTTKRQKLIWSEFQCPYEDCGKFFSRPSVLKEHIYTHTGEHPFQCDQCAESFSKSKELTAHKDESHADLKPFKCSFPECNFRCRKLSYFRRHESLHLQPNPFKCTDFPPCEDSFRKKHQLRAHITEAHTHIPAFPCPHREEEGCKAAFSIQSKLAHHIQKWHTPRYFCDDCPESFPLLVDLQRHRKEEHPPRCFKCDIVFATNDVLEKHLDIHRRSLEERKQFACHYEGCTKRYTKPFALKNHIRTVHEKSKPFVCAFEGCNRAFGFKKVLQRHELTHTQPATPREIKKVVKAVDLLDEIAGTGYEDTGRKICCTIEGCEWRFTREYDLRRHLKSFHGLEFGEMAESLEENGVQDTL